MKNTLRRFLNTALLLASVTALAQTEIDLRRDIDIYGTAKPIRVNLSGITGEAAQVIQFDLYVQGFAFTDAESAQYLITGSANGNLTARVTDKIANSSKLAKAYTGGSLRRRVTA